MGVTSVDTVVVCVMTDWAQTALVSAAELVNGGLTGSELVCVTILDEALFGILGHSSLPTPVRHSGSNKKNVHAGRSKKVIFRHFMREKKKPHHEKTEMGLKTSWSQFDKYQCYNRGSVGCSGLKVWSRDFREKGSGFREM